MLNTDKPKIHALILLISNFSECGSCQTRALVHELFHQITVFYLKQGHCSHKKADSIVSQKHLMGGSSTWTLDSETAITNCSNSPRMYPNYPLGDNNSQFKKYQTQGRAREMPKLSNKLCRSSSILYSRLPAPQTRSRGGGWVLPLVTRKIFDSASDSEHSKSLPAFQTAAFRHLWLTSYIPPFYHYGCFRRVCLSGEGNPAHGKSRFPSLHSGN